MVFPLAPQQHAHFLLWPGRLNFFVHHVPKLLCCTRLGGENATSKKCNAVHINNENEEKYSNISFFCNWIITQGYAFDLYLQFDNVKIYPCSISTVNSCFPLEITKTNVAQLSHSWVWQEWTWSEHGNQCGKRHSKQKLVINKKQTHGRSKKIVSQRKQEYPSAHHKHALLHHCRIVESTEISVCQWDWQRVAENNTGCSSLRSDINRMAVPAVPSIASFTTPSAKTLSIAKAAVSCGSCANVCPAL